jgi:hypothetical protein
MLDLSMITRPLASQARPSNDLRPPALCVPSCVKDPCLSSLSNCGVVVVVYNWLSVSRARFVTVGLWKFCAYVPLGPAPRCKLHSVTDFEYGTVSPLRVSYENLMHS